MPLAGHIPDLGCDTLRKAGVSFGRGGATTGSRRARDSREKAYLVRALRGCFRLRLGRLGVEQGQRLLVGVVDGRTWPWSTSEVIREGILGKRRKKVMGGKKRNERKKEKEREREKKK